MPEFFDYKIDAIWTNGCSECFLSEQEMFEYAIAWIIKNGPLPLPNPGECETKYRVAYASCWEWRNPFLEDVFIPCSPEGCCWSVYKVCNDGGVITSTRILGTLANYQDCGLIIEACVFICDEELLPPAINQIDDNIVLKKNTKSFVVPNPNNGISELHFASNFSGEISIQIFDINGNSIKTIIRNKATKEIIIPIDISKNASGTYLYKVFYKDMEISKGEIILNR